MNNTVTILRQYSDNLFFGIADNTDHEIQYHKYSDNIFINTEQYENIYCVTYCQPYYTVLLFVLSTIQQQYATIRDIRIVIRIVIM